MTRFRPTRAYVLGTFFVGDGGREVCRKMTNMLGYDLDKNTIKTDCTPGKLKFSKHVRFLMDVSLCFGTCFVGRRSSGGKNGHSGRG